MKCDLCPRHCEADRINKLGYCGAGVYSKIGRAALHFFEEPCISGENGSGAVFFSGCNLKCIFCQNHVLQSGEKGLTVTAENLADIFLELQAQKAHNINLVTPTPHINSIILALENAKKRGLTIPVVYNTNSYMEVESIRKLRGLVDIWLPDLKYKDSRLSAKLSFAPDYFSKAIRALSEMYSQSGQLVFDSKGMAIKGVLIRHLIMPGCVYDSRNILDEIKENFGTTTCISLMSQYTPTESLPSPFNRKITPREYSTAVEYAESIGFSNIYTQKLSSATFEYTPDFNLG